METKLYDSLSHLLEQFDADPLLDDEQKDGIAVLDYRSIDGTIRAVPTPLSPWLYRGQTRAWPTVIPKLYRGLTRVNDPRLLPQSELAKFLLRIAQQRRFETALRNHPHGRLRNRTVLHIEPTALAQHYGLPTSYVDLTQSVLVAAFFATCEPVDGDRWRPAGSGEGIIYRVPLSTKTVFRFYVPLAMPYFHRPYAQRAWACSMKPWASFDQDSSVETFRFRHSLAESKAVFEEFEGGASLFPADTLAALARALLITRRIPLVAVKEAIMHSGILDPALDRLADRHASRIAQHTQVEVTEDSDVRLCDAEEWERLLREEEEFTASLVALDKSIAHDVFDGKVVPLPTMPGSATTPE